MTEIKRALLVGYSYDNNQQFKRVPAAKNINELTAVLENQNIGNFYVESLFDKPLQEVKEKIEGFFRDSMPDDLLLLYFSGHGVLDSRGRLYLTTPDTIRKRLNTTAIPARDVRSWMEFPTSRSKKIVLLLDCCHGDAVDRSLTRQESPGAERALGELSGEGRIIITASDMGRAWESAFTNAVVKGLTTGDADLDGDGDVHVRELYEYVYDEVQRQYPDQRPTMRGTTIGRLVLAQSPHGPLQPLPLPDKLAQHVNDKQDAQKRRAAVHGLKYLIDGEFPAGLKVTARQNLRNLCEDTDAAVRDAARQVLPSVIPPRAVPHETSRQRWVKAAWAVTLVMALVVVPPWVVSRFLPAPGPCTPIAKSANGALSFGTLLPNTGEFVSYGPALDAGVKLAMQDINAAGGIPGIAMRFDESNQRDEGSPAGQTASQSVDELLKGDVDVIVGPATSPVALKVIDKVVCAGMIMFSPGNTATAFTTYPDHGLYFRTAPSSELEGTALGRLINRDRNSTVAMMYRNDAFGNSLHESTEKAIKKSAQKVYSFGYDPGARDHDKEIQEIKAKNPDAIVLIGFNESARILATMIREGLGPKNKHVYTSGTLMTNTMAGLVNRNDPDALEGMQGTLIDAGDAVFVKRLRDANPGLVDVAYAAQVYDAVVVTALAAAVARTDEPAAVARQINEVTRRGVKCTSFAACVRLVKNSQDIDYDGPSGPLEFNDPGEPSSATYVISKIGNDGTVIPLMKEIISSADVAQGG